MIRNMKRFIVRYKIRNMIRNKKEKKKEEGFVINVRKNFLKFYALWRDESVKEIVRFYKKQGKEIVELIDFTRAMQGISEGVESHIYLKTGEMVKKELLPMMVSASSTVHSAILRQVEKQKGMELNEVKQDTDKVLAYINEHAAELIEYLSEQQKKVIKEILNKVVQNELSIYEAREMIEKTVGLTERETMWVLARYRAMVAEGLPSSRIDLLISAFANNLLEARADRILRTELANAWENASLETVRQLTKLEYIKEVIKSWETAADPRVCSICMANEEDGYIELEGVFSSGQERPPAHPSCRCTLFYKAKEGING